MTWVKVASLPAGKDGRNGSDGVVGRDGLPGVQGPAGKDGKDGIHGKDGIDGFGPDDMDEEYEDDGRVLVRRWKFGDRVKEFRHITLTQIWRGVFNAGQTYLRGDTVTWSGSQWHAMKTTTEKPGESHDWVQCVMRGKPGERGQKGGDGQSGPAGPQGPPGPRWS